jgi:phosphonate transport system ATP-binding protein
MSLHQVDLAKTYADRIIGISQGHVVFDGNAADIEESELNRIYGNTENIHLDDAEELTEKAFGKASHRVGRR